MALPSSILQRGLRAAQPAATSVAVGVTYYVEDELLTEQSNGTIWEPYSAAGAGTGDVSGPGSSVDKEIALFDGTGGVLLERATGTGIVRVTSGVYGTPGNVVESEITLADNTTNDVSTTKHGFAPKLSNVGTEYLDGTGGYSVPAGSGGGMGLAMLGTFTPVVDGDFAWVNQNSASITQVGDGVVLTGAAAGSGDWEWAMRVKSAPSTPYTITAYIVPSPTRQDFRFDGLIFRASGDGKFSAFGNAYNSFGGAQVMWANNYSGPTASNATLLSSGWAANHTPYWLQISDDGSDRYYRYSTNGTTFVQFYTEGRTTYFTADQVGFGINRRAAGTPILTVLSWTET